MATADYRKCWQGSDCLFVEIEDGMEVFDRRA